MSKLLKTLMILGVVVFAFAPSAHATKPGGTGTIGICNADWIPNSSTYCSTQSGLDFGLTFDSNPTFNIAASPGATTTSTDLVILVPNTGSAILPFTATFTEYNSSGNPIDSAMVTVTSPSGPGSPFSSGSLLQSYLGLTLSGAGDYQFSQILDHELNTSATAFNVYLLTTSLQLASGDYVTVTFSSGASFPYGTIFLALGDNGGDITQVTPFTMSLQEVPEPMTLSLFGSGLLGIALIVRRRMRREAEDSVSKV